MFFNISLKYLLIWSTGWVGSLRDYRENNLVTNALAYYIVVLSTGVERFYNDTPWGPTSLRMLQNKLACLMLKRFLRGHLQNGLAYYTQLFLVDQNS